MERFSLIVVSDETAPIRRFDVAKSMVRRAAWIAGGVALLLAIGFVDYVRVRIDHLELAQLRVETAGQRRQIADFEAELGELDGTLVRLKEFERKVRVIANLPGAAGTGGEQVTVVGPSPGGDVAATEQEGAVAPPAEGAQAAGALEGQQDSPAADPSPEGRLSRLHEEADALEVVARSRADSLDDLVGQLEEKRHRLASTPAIWPTRGWLTSRFGPRISPFTGARQFHAGLDIAGAIGTDVVAPARGKVVFSGKKGPLGKSVVIDHGYAVRTIYGHAQELHVKRGEQVERGQRIASLGNSGRSTGPHLHYVVEVGGKSVNPLDYIFD